MPQELLFELNAALDHLSRHWVYGEEEKKTVHQAYGHMKRACLDVFKIRFKTAIDQLQELQESDISIINNGKFQTNLYALAAMIKRQARDARSAEGNLDTTFEIPAFTLWEEVWVNCIRLEEDFYLNANIPWAKEQAKKTAWKQHKKGFFIGIAASVVAAGVCFLIVEGVKRIFLILVASNALLAF